MPYSAATVAVRAWGNSLVAGVGASDLAHSWPGALATMSALGPYGIPVINSGISGQTLTTTNIYDGTKPRMIDTGPSTVDANFVAGKTNILIVQEITNELQSNGANPSTCLASLATVINARRSAASAAGVILKVVLLGVAPGAYQPPGQTEVNAQCAAMKATNVLLRANWSTYADAFVDIAMYAPFRTLFDNGDYSTTAFANSGAYTRTGGQGDGAAIDYLHWNDPTYAAIAGLVNTAVANLLAGYQSVTGAVSYYDADDTFAASASRFSAAQNAQGYATSSYDDQTSVFSLTTRAGRFATTAYVTYNDGDDYPQDLFGRLYDKIRFATVKLIGGQATRSTVFQGSTLTFQADFRDAQRQPAEPQEVTWRVVSERGSVMASGTTFAAAQAIFTVPPQSLRGEFSDYGQRTLEVDVIHNLTDRMQTKCDFTVRSTYRQ